MMNNNTNTNENKNINKKQTNNYKHSTNNQNNSKGTPTISFATHNVNSLQCTVKNQFINDSFIDFNTDFVGLTETRHKSDQTFRYAHDPDYTSFWSTCLNPYA